MSFWTGLYTLLLKPLELIFEVIYNAAYNNIGNAGLAIIALSLAMNFLVLPLYRRADAMQEEERDTEARLSKWVNHIKQTFSGDERTMMLQTYYRQNNYSPLHVLRGAVSLFLEIPFFIAAYRFLSHLSLLDGVAFGTIADLSKPDALLCIGGVAINVLPFLMTTINIVSSAIFSKGYPVKTKIQLYGMAAVFLVLLYNSPSGLVFYWTLNNLFSLVKTVFYKIKHPRIILSFLAMLLGLFLLYWAFGTFINGLRRKAVFIAFVAMVFILQFFYALIKRKKGFAVKFPEIQSDRRVFLLGALFLSVLTGALIPSAVIEASPQEFISTVYFVHPIWYIVNSLLLALGMFAIWLGVFYRLASPKVKPYFEAAVWALCGIALVDYLFFGTNLGTMSADLIFDSELIFSLSEIALNLLAVLAVLAAFIFLLVRHKKLVRSSLAVVLTAVILMSSANCIGFSKNIACLNLSEEDSITDEEAPYFTLSKNEKNVVVIMLDRAMGEYIPYIFNEKPELKEQFSGFTYYSNVISFGGHTNFATPALFGGYEYTPVEINKRADESLKDKQNEALKVLPVLFDSNGYDVTVFDPPYANYQWTADLSIYDEYDGINSFVTNGYFADEETYPTTVENRNRDFFCYSLTKILPLFSQRALYSNGSYNKCDNLDSTQIVMNQSKSNGISSSFKNAYDVLENMSNMTTLTDSENGSFLIMTNDTTHNCNLLSEPSYTPSKVVDNTEYDSENADRFTIDGQTLEMSNSNCYAAYQSNMAALIKLGEWFDHLKENDVYDNTKIIIVSDHGFALSQLESLILDDEVYEQSNGDDKLDDAEFYYPLLMVKDFGDTEFTVSDEFMTNADVPTLAVQDVIENPVNPFTGKTIDNTEKYSHNQYIIASSEWDISVNNGNTFLPAKWYSIHDSIWAKSNWTVVAENAILP